MIHFREQDVRYTNRKMGMSFNKSFLHISKSNRVGACIGAFLLCFALTLGFNPGVAQADVRQSDVIAGMSVESRGLNAASCPNVVAEYAYVVDDQGKVYFERGADAQTHIASITKVMTALVALEYGDPQTTTINVSQTAATIGESSAMLQTGDSMNLETALKALMIPSGNDAAQAIAESMGDSIKQQLQEQGDSNVPDSAYDAFVYAMNKKAQELGMTNSLFANPHGLDIDDHDEEMYCSARDVATMVSEVMKNDTFRNIVSMDGATIQVSRKGETVDIPLESTDILIGSYEGACGVKTGFTEKAGQCFAGAVERDGETLYAVVLNSNSEQQRFTDATTLDDWVFDNTIAYALAHSPETTSMTTTDGQTTEVPVVAYVSHSGWIDKTFKATFADPKASVEVFALEGNVSQKLEFDTVSGEVSVGQKVGTATFYQHNKEIASCDIVAAESCSAPNFIDGIGIWWDRLWRGFNGQQTSAESVVVNTTPLIYGSNATLNAN